MRQKGLPKGFLKPQSKNYFPGWVYIFLCQASRRRTDGGRRKRRWRRRKVGEKEEEGEEWRGE
eukprot:3352003-Pyramimonas_sp.AAC.2